LATYQQPYHLWLPVSRQKGVRNLLPIGTLHFEVGDRLHPHWTENIGNPNNKKAGISDGFGMSLDVVGYDCGCGGGI
jgi:hypothetical protein